MKTIKQQQIENVIVVAVCCFLLVVAICLLVDTERTRKKSITSAKLVKELIQSCNGDIMPGSYKFNGEQASIVCANGLDRVIVIPFEQQVLVTE